jgi:hypothetical protein
MVKKGLLALLIVVLAAGGAFAQKNTVTVDVGPTIAGFAAGSLAKTAADKLTDNISDASLSGFGIGAQYERQILSQLSVALRGVYGAYDGSLSYKEGIATAKPDLDLTSLAVEGHVRFYPFGETFFLDGMLGYARLSTDLKGKVIAKVGSGSEQRDADVSESSNYLKYGAKVGWRISFGRNGGFTLEPAVGWYFGNALGDALGKQVSASINKKIPPGYELVGIDDAFSALENYVFIGGPRVSLAVGYRF